MKDLAPPQPSLRPSNPDAEDGRVAKEIRRCLELVQTCHQDLQHLIDLRNEHLKLLEAAPPRILDRINRVIDSANQGLVEGRRIVEKCRPKAHRGMKMTLHNRLEWVLRSSVDFRGQEPVIIRHNAAVLAELNYLRQITTCTLLDNIPTTKEDPDVAPLRISQGINKKASASVPAIPVSSMPSSRAATPKVIEYCDLPEPVFPNALPGATPDKETLVLAVQPPSAHLPTILGEDASPHRVVLGPSDDRGLLLLFEG
ncbi:hypothetical protein H634G_05449 [Metarhizium anisopliae BRIP 53293]|uniref:Uncharacterized protein n=1 Tax=Metarhizium anisopliae BRIP 53293 TaxID=1291518 RepID=A0A0D9NYW9_METAN|nr:hypothetical protein H634G_05449 [Metarhizium anisopliae BRIP 53293]KJK91459.1 hypothetical protein H633G_04674 [Metarhizium anisopliae BRIP 53284]